MRRSIWLSLRRAIRLPRSWQTRSLSLPILVVALLALLLLAVVQFIWIGQLSQSARERMQADASNGAADLSEAFDREVVRAYLDLQMDALTLRDRQWGTYKQRYETWHAATPYPGLVKTIYLAEIGRNGTLALSEFDAQQSTFTPRMWTSEFAGLLRSLDTTYRTRRVEGELIVGNSPAPIDEALPALVVPVARPWLLGTPATNEPDLLDADVMIGGSIFTRSRRPCLNCDSYGPLFAYTIIHLDESALARQVIPALAKRHLGGGGLADYHLSIVSRRNPARLIYQSDPEVPPATAPADATADMLTLRLDEFNRLMIELGRDPAGQEERGAERQMRIAIGVVGNNDQATIEGVESSGWQLRLNHRAGSLEAAVSSLRRRNQLISFGTILLLGIALAMIVISSRRTQRLARQKVEYVAAISHELRTPLTVICSAGANLADGLVDSPQRARQYGALIVREGRRLTEMVEQTLAYAGTQSEDARPEHRLIDPRAIVERALAAARTQFEEQGFTLEYSADAGLPAVWGDVEALQRAVHNLIGNALKYAADGRWLRVAVRAERADRRTEVVISVQDRGPGINPADLPHVFDPFYRGRDAVDSQIYGSGLGLSLVRLAAEAHDGRVDVISQPGQGCTFTLRLPAARNAEQTYPLGSEVGG